MITKLFEPPPNERPYHPAHLAGDELRIDSAGQSMLFRQVGWHGQTGALYGLDEDPSRYEPGSFSPLWLLVDNEPIPEEKT